MPGVPGRPAGKAPPPSSPPPQSLRTVHRTGLISLLSDRLACACVPVSCLPPRIALPPQEGIESYSAALQCDPGSKDLWLNLGMALKEQSVVERASKVSVSEGVRA